VRLRKLRRLAEISPNDCLFLIQLVLLSLIVRVGVRVIGLPCLIGCMTRGAQNCWLDHLPWRHGWYEVAQLVTLADLAARVTHGQGRCLARSLLLFWLLKVRGEPAEFLLGVRKEATAFYSHAWIELRRWVIGDTPQSIGRFAILLHF